MKNMSICWPKASVTFCSSSLIFSGLWNGMILGNKERQQGQRLEMEAGVVSSFTSSDSETQNSGWLAANFFKTLWYNIKKEGVKRKQNGVKCVSEYLFKPLYDVLYKIYRPAHHREGRADVKGPLINAIKTDNLGHMCLIYCTPTCVRVSAHTESQLIIKCLQCRVHMWMRLQKPCMHECASQSVCASATVSTPLGLSTEPAQRQMGNFLRGKGKKSGAAAKSSRMCVFPSSLKEWQSERYRVVGIFTDWGKGENEGDGLTKLKERNRKTFSTAFLRLSPSSLSSFEEPTAHYLFIVSR